MTALESIGSMRALAGRGAALAGFLALAACGSSSGGGGGGGSAVQDQDSGPVTYPSTDSNAMCQATVTQGAMNGKTVGATCEYLGVPYAMPPTGSLRFMPPKPAANWSSPLDASKFGPSCIQASSTLGPVGAQSEDCLTLNVYTPQAAPAKPLPVMVFIYGGAFTSGSSSLYDGQGMSERGPVIVVSMNYRLGALGFLGLPELDAARSGAPSGSDGIRDQALALQWVKDNIATFHGDPTNVTVFGESAGSMSTCIHLVSPGSQGLANRYMMESGACIGKATLLNTQATTYGLSEQLATALCAPTTDDDGGSEGGATTTTEFDATSPAVLDCLQKADATQLMTWVPPAGTSTAGVNALVGNLLGPPFAPTIEGVPGGVLPDTPENLIAQGKFNKDAAILAGTNQNEWGLFVYLASTPALGGSATSPLNITTSAELNSGIEKIFGAGASQVETQYPSTDATANQVFVDLVTDYAFRCPTRTLARSTMAQGTKNYFLYNYDIGKSWHSFELVPLFNVSELTLIGATQPSKAYTATMQDYWTQFAISGNPNGSGDAGAPMWPSYDVASDEYLQLQDPTPMQITNWHKAQCDFWDSFNVAPVTAPTSGADAGVTITGI
jgi:para-nitrobenzyl esterase